MVISHIKSILERENSGDMFTDIKFLHDLRQALMNAEGHRNNLSIHINTNFDMLMHILMCNLILWNIRIFDQF